MTGRHAVNFEVVANFVETIPKTGGWCSRAGESPANNTAYQMKTAALRLPLIATLATSLTLGAAAESAPAGLVEFGKFTPSSSADQFVEVKLGASVIQLASKLTRKHEPDVAELLMNVHSVRVNVVGLGDDNREQTTHKLQAIRSDLEGKGWERIVNAQEKNQDVSVFLKTRNADTVEGIVVTVIENNREAVFVNVVGDVKVDQLVTLGDKLNLEPLKQVGAAVEKKGEAKSTGESKDPTENKEQK